MLKNNFMIRLSFIGCLLCLSISNHLFAQEKDGQFVLVIHGGAGTITRSLLTPEKEAEIRQKLEEALLVGYEILKNEGSSLEAIVATLKILENSPLFNAGKGAVFTNAGRNEMDAAIMDGNTHKAGAVAGVSTIKNPITGALAVMKHSEHVMMSGKGAEDFADELGLELVDPSYFYTEERFRQLKKIKGTEEGLSPEKFHDYKFGTVGAVALDTHGNLAAGTSTGGMTNKKYGRIGDSPIIGAGTYADNETCAISATGHGEFFIRSVVAHDISALMKYKLLSLEEAANEVVMNKLVDKGGSGGIIGVDKQGNITMPFNTKGMYRGSVRKDEKPTIAIYQKD